MIDKESRSYIKMKPTTKRTRRTLFLAAGLLLAAALLYLLYLRPTPIKTNFFTTVDNEHTIIFEAVNEGIADVQLLDVLVNGGRRPVKAELGVSYSLHLVGGSNLEGNPDIAFVGLGDMPLHPDLPPEDKRAALNQSPRIPLNYGIRLFHDEPIREVELKYRYLGLIFKRDVSMGRFFQE